MGQAIRPGYSLGRPPDPHRGGPASTVIELAERPAASSPPRVPAGWYDPDSSAFEPLAGTVPMTEAVAADVEPAGTGYRASEAERRVGEAVEAGAGLPAGRTTSRV